LYQVFSFLKVVLMKLLAFGMVSLGVELVGFGSVHFGGCF
jgi:hypothetical protein